MRFLSGTGGLGRRLGLALLLGLLALPVAAQTAGPISIQSLFLNQSGNAHHGNYLEADAGLLYNDNVYLTPGGSGDGIALIGLVGNTERTNAPRFDYHLDSDLVVAKYFKSEFQTQPYGYLDAFGEFKIDPGTLSWTGRESYSQVLINPTSPGTPNNLESINYLTTGPKLTLTPTLRTTVVLDGSYSIVDSNSNSPDYVNINNHRYGADLRIDRAFTNTFSAYLTGSYSKVQFSDTTENTDFDLWQGLAGFRWVNARTVLDIAGGYNKAHLEGAPANPYPVPHGALLDATPITGCSDRARSCRHVVEYAESQRQHLAGEPLAPDLAQRPRFNPCPKTGDGLGEPFSPEPRSAGTRQRADSTRHVKPADAQGVWGDLDV